MTTRGFTRQFLPILLLACAVLPFLSACGQQIAITDVPPAQPTDALQTIEPSVQATQPSTEVALPPVAASGEVSLDFSAVAQNQTAEIVEAVPPDPNAMWWGPAPEHYRVTLAGYPVSDHQRLPQIFVYPTAGLAEYNDTARQMQADLQALLQTKQPGDELPFLPLINAKQIIRAQVQFLDFQNGSGVRYLTQYNTGIVPVNNRQLLYTFQGLTADGMYYVAAVMPVTHPELPATDQVAQVNDYPSVLDQTVAMLESQPAVSFTPDLAQLDALIQSIEVK